MNVNQLPFYVLHWSGWLCVVDGVGATQEIAEGLRVKAQTESPYPIICEVHQGLPFGNPISMSQAAQRQEQLIRTYSVTP